MMFGLGTPFPSGGGGGGREEPGRSDGGHAFAGLTTPFGPSLRSGHQPLLCEEGNLSANYYEHRTSDTA